LAVQRHHPNRPSMNDFLGQIIVMVM